MPAFLAVAASSFPTSAACSLLSPLNVFFSPRHDANASVRPLRSSTSCASMPRFDRKTTRRGRCAEPCTLPRTRLWRRARPSLTVRLGTLTNLSADVLAVVADALALVRLGRAHLANLCRRLADLLLIRPLHDDLRRSGNLEGDARARLDRDGMRVADLQLQVRALERRAVADPLDLEALLEALRHTLDHVRDECPRQAVQRAIVAALRRTRDDDGAVLLRDRHARRHVLLEGPERACDGHAPRLHRHRHAGGALDGLSSDSAHEISPPSESKSL